MSSEPGTLPQIVDCWAKSVIDKNEIRQLLVSQQPVAIDRDGEHYIVQTANGQWRVYFAGQKYEGWDLSLRCPLRVDSFADASPVSLSWLGGRPLTSSREVVDSYSAPFNFLEENLAAGTPGLRSPQIGAIHSVLGYWTTKNEQPITVVMPTGTGKTEVMVSLLVAARIERLLVVVPSDALRTQIAQKFETLGVLQKYGIVHEAALRPVVGQLRHRLSTVEVAESFALACNVIVATPSSLAACSAEIRAALTAGCSHLFVDEAHHVAAATWQSIRNQFEGKPVVQFTATPYREDGRQLGGRQIYAFPLREAQRQGYFSKIRYISVVDLADSDRSIAIKAIERLRSDLHDGRDHLIMARVNRIGRAQDLLALYQDLAEDLNPVIVHSSARRRARENALDAIDNRDSRIILCVDMLGEGFDLPSLKIAAIHDAHKSLGVTLQFVGRFARVAGEQIGDATVVVGRPTGDYDPTLRQLYSEDADWNLIIQDLSESAVESQQDISEFEASFSNVPDFVTFKNLAPKMSTVVYRTFCEDWNPYGISEVFSEERLLTFPIPMNLREGVIWYVTKNVEPVQWGELRTVEEVSYELFVLYWDKTNSLLYINCSNTGSHYESLAKAVGGDSVTLIRGETIYRVMADMTRLVPTNVGVLDIRNRGRRFSMYVGADVTDGFPTAEAQTKTQTNIFAYGYEDGMRVSIGASLKGRVWSFRVASTIKQWVNWCNHIGAKLINDGISIDSVMRGFIRPEIVEDRPQLVPLALEWPWQIYASLTEELKVDNEESSCPLVDTELRLNSHTDSGNIAFSIITHEWSAEYELTFGPDGLNYNAIGPEVVVTNRRSRVAMSVFLKTYGLTILFEDDVTVVHPGLLLRPNRNIAPFEVEGLKVLDWSGIDLHKESQGESKDADSIQARMITEMIASNRWDVVIDDDGSGEIADIVCLKIESDELLINLLHCKYSSGDSPGARINDIYEVCGQAEKSTRWRRDVGLLVQQLIRRESRRLQRGARSGFELGSAQKLFEIEERARLLRPQFNIGIAQPGLSKSRATESQLHVLACVQVYLYECASSELTIYCSA